MSRARYCTLSVAFFMYVGCADDSTSKEEDANNAQAAASDSWSAEYTGDIQGSVQGEYAVSDVQPGDRFALTLSPDQDSYLDQTTPTRLFFVVRGVKEGDTGTFEGPAVVTPSVRLEAAGEGDCGGNGSMTLTKHDATSVEGSFAIDVSCTRDGGELVFSISGNFVDAR